MSWPTPQDYNEAIQNPALNLADPELKAGTPELTSLGLPRPITGGCVSVYRMRCGSRDWAVRCFLREVPDQQKRYAAISRHLASARLPYTVGFQFLPQGIRIRGQWFPILKMEWVQGEPLNLYIENHLHNPAALKDLTRRWVTMTEALAQACIAHGDLQHGNILVAGGDLKLIDYDGMFVPALSGQPSHEVGHRNYQHPRRDQKDSGPALDHFSAWVIYLSLAALSAEPDLWQKLGAGDESLLFRKEDFDRPQASEAFTLLAQHPEARVRALAAQFTSLLAGSPQDVPSLESALTPRVARPSGRRKAASRSAPATAASSAQSVVRPAARPAWVMESLSQTGPQKAFRLPLALPRLLLALALPLALLLALCLHGPFLLNVFRCLAFCLSLAFAGVGVRYRREPAAVERHALLARERAIRRAITAIERTAEGNEKRHAALDAEEIHRREALEGWKRDLQAREHQELSEVHAALKAARDTIVARRKAQAQEEEEALAQIRARRCPGLEAIDQEIEAVEKEQAERLARALQARQHDFLEMFLQEQSLWKAALPGIGRAVRLRLRVQGIGTAADIDTDVLQSLHWLAPPHQNALVAWRQDLEAKACSAMPHALSAEEALRITDPFERRRARLQARRDQRQARLTAEEAALRNQFRQEAEALDAQQSDAQARAARQSKSIQERYVPNYARIEQSLTDLEAAMAAQRRRIDDETDEAQQQLPSHHWQLTQLQRDLEPYQNLTFARYLRVLFLNR